MMDKVHSSLGAKHLDKSGYKVSVRDKVDLYGENDQLDVDSWFRPGIDIPFSPLTFNDYEMSSMAENPILNDEEQDKENSPPPVLTSPVSERPTELLALMRSCPFGTKIVRIPEYPERNLFEYFLSLSCMCFIKTSN